MNNVDDEIKEKVLSEAENSESRDNDSVSVESEKDKRIKELEAEIARLKQEKEEKIEQKKEESKKVEPKKEEKVEQKKVPTEKKESVSKKVKINEINEIEPIDDLILKIKDRIENFGKRYFELKKIVDKFVEEEYKIFDKDGLITLEELTKLNKSFESIDKYLDEMILLKKQGNRELAKIEVLEKRKEVLLQDKANKEVLELTDEEYKEIVKTLKEKNLLREITKKEGLYEIYKKDVKDRTPEEQERLTKVIKATFNEIIKCKNIHQELSITEIINGLYNVEEKIVKKEEPEKIEMKQEEIVKVKENADLLPVKVNINLPVVTDYVPDPVPEDMQEVMKRGLEEKVRILVNKDTNERYLNEVNLDRFGIRDYGDEVEYDGVIYAQINDVDFAYIKEQASNDVAPYTIEFENIKFLEDEEEIDVDSVIDKIVGTTDVDYDEFGYYMASNIKVSERFKREVQSDDVLYNIIHIVPSSIKFVFGGIKKLYGQFMTTDYATSELDELKSRLNSLSDKELEVLARDYTEDKEIENEFLNDIILHRIAMYKEEETKHPIDEMFDEYLQDEQENKVR